VERVVEGADEEDVRLGGAGRHETKVRDALSITTRRGWG
jgi:hypothetical protein